MKRIVIDASVAPIWCLADEEYGQKALSILDKYVSKEIDIVAPSLLEYEVINGLLIAKKRGRIEEEKILMAADGFTSLELNLKNTSFLYPKVIEYCNLFNRSANDSSYLALADDERARFITADRGLYTTVKKDLKWEWWLGDFSLSD